jgi:hypothetical protein
MNRRYAGVVLLVVQLVLVLSIAAKYLYERKTMPAVWVRTVPFDPGQPLRGRYLALQLTVDACGLPRSNEYRGYVYQPAAGPRSATMWEWNTTLKARNGKLVAVLDGNPVNPSETQHITHTEGTPCDQALLHSDTDFYIPDTTTLPLTHAPNQTLWVLVTVPRTGPPRPIELAVSDPSGFHPLSVH